MRIILVRNCNVLALLGNLLSHERSMSSCSFALVVACLRDAQIDDRVFSFKDVSNLDALSSTLSEDGSSMILFGDTIRNLDVLPTERNRYFNLLCLLDHTSTQFGKRMLKHWICNPLLRKDDITQRQQALTALHELPQFVGRAKLAMKKMCDFERVMVSIYSCCARQKDHPGNEAILYEAENMTKRSVASLISCLRSFESACDLLTELDNVLGHEHIGLLRSLLNSLGLPVFKNAIDTFKDSFDIEEAAAENKITPAKGVYPEYDGAKEKLERLHQEAEEYRKSQSKFFGTSIAFWGQGNNAFQLEVPESAKRKASSEYVFSSQRKGFTRYTTSACLNFREKVLEAEEELRNVLGDVNRVMFQKFYDNKSVWQKATSVVATLDCLISLQDYSFGLTDEAVFPRVEDTGEPFLTIKNGKHPLMVQWTDRMVIPNDIHLDDKVRLDLDPWQF